ncbi:MAG: DMT family transporter [Rhizobiales bacterium]|nr:DMT family transporter [Hyphomicrobiales bacterium]
MAPMPPAAGETAERLRGIGFFCLALLLFAFLDTSAKYASRHVPVMEVVFFRYAGAMVLCLLAFRPWRNHARFLTARPIRQLLRSAFLLGSTVLNFLALRKLQLAETTTISFAGAFVVAGLAVPLLGEWIGPRRWIAILVGFAGVVVVTRPGPAGLQPAVLLSIGSMLCNSFYSILTRYLAPTDSAEGLLLFPLVTSTIAVAPFALPGFVWPDEPLIGLLLLAVGFLGAIGHWCYILAYRHAPASTLAPFAYSQLLWMVGLGFLVFDDVPHATTLLGAAIIIASGLYILYREHVHGGR